MLVGADTAGMGGGGAGARTKPGGTKLGAGAAAGISGPAGAIRVTGSPRFD